MSSRSGRDQTRALRWVIDETRSLRAHFIRTVRHGAATLRQQGFRYQESQGYLAVHFSNPVGLGARLVWCLQVLKYCDDRGIDAHFKFSMPGEPLVDFFGPNFRIERTAPTKTPRFFIRTGTIRDLNFETPTLEEGQALVRKYLRAQPDLVQEVEDFWQAHQLQGRVLGVHYRGTDKVSEAPRLSYQAMAAGVVESLLKHQDTVAVFVSSDEQPFVDFMRVHFDSTRIVSRDDFRRSSGRTEVHHDLDAVLSIQRDAAINMLLLARCTSLIKTASFLSAFSVLMNPDLEVAMLNRPDDDSLHFPERELLELQQGANPLRGCGQP